MKREHRCFALFSGGLDSVLAVKYMERLGYEVTALFFDTPFFSASSAIKAAEINNINLKVVDITSEHLEMMKNPRYGFGKNMNPCIDCHGLMFKKAGEMMKDWGVDFLISGEVLGQRPMSQRNDSMNSVAKLSKVKDLLVRPLCQKLIRETLPIREGWVDKDEMLDIQGRGRYRQLDLAREFEIEEYQTPGGGCLLTDVSFSRKLKDLFKHDVYDAEAIKLLKQGRHFRLTESVKFIVGRNDAENDIIGDNAGKSLVMQTDEIPGPLGLLLSVRDVDLETLSKAGSLLLRYNNKAPEEAVIKYGFNFNLDKEIVVRKMKPVEAEKYLI